MTTIGDGQGEVTLTFNVPGNAGPALIVHGFTWDALTDPDDVANGIGTDFMGDFGASIQLSTSLIKARVVINDAGTLKEGTSSFSTAGTGLGSAAPPNVAYLIRKTTGLAGREFRGRMYIPGVDEGNVDASGNLLTAAFNALQTQADSYLTTLTTNDYPMVLLHDDPLVDENTVTALQADAKVATQRRRLR